ncbi:lamin tail domain-containing protein [archaeon]|jgi:hypothetical protein|nr:lamin tail domain-containing protein [archaeon]MBT4417102.1 lamin tail domain-containing protein [archaeon]
MKKTILILAMLLCTNFVAADVLITEIMHSPVNTESDTDGEWAEIFNSGTEAVDLTDYKLDGYNFDDEVLSSGEYLIIARELIDGDDEDNESFECVYGNCNGMWDESFGAVDGYFSFSAEDTVVLSNGEEVVDQVTYSNTSVCIERVSLDSWEESSGTPGVGYMQEDEEDGIVVYVNVENNVPVVNEFSILTDDAEDAGVQVLPSITGETEVSVLVNASDSDEDIQNVYVTVGNRTFNLSYHNGTYNGSFFMMNEVAGFYSVNVSVCDYESCVGDSSDFEFLGMIVTSLNVSSLSFDDGQEQGFEVVNSGNVVLDFEVSGTDLVFGENTLSISSFSVYESEWVALSLDGVYLDRDSLPGTSEDFALKFDLPDGTRSGDYQGVISVIGMENEGV